ncbi:maltose ABC transporter substrate-binding protein [Actinocorallia sp. API 0066]|uniref:sugar ABC transporter substrate-binding protein n=1 Tax=Actinocorallia sp. API 0066 TaxID=2896846 RepID=UPI001E2BB44B|nr:maltose ABC transporter substrate-binding protein [Actinocorallia sp. API 0066]MCD0450498.1 maltose ABC transporter substrate-binding protein [Actinocorallia sp. API 0066]
MRRTLSLLAGTVLASAVLTGCGGDADTPSTAAPGTTLVIWADQRRADALKPFAAAFAADNGVKAEVVAVTQNQQQTFVTASQAGKGPDVMVGAHDWIGNLVQNGLIDPIQVSDSEMDGYVDVARKAVTYQGKVYAVPYAVESLVLYRNTELAPDAPETVEDLVAQGERLRRTGKASQVIGYPISQQDGQSGDTYHMYPLFTSGGGYLFGTDAQGDPDPSDLGVGTPASIKAFERIAALGEKGSGVLRRSSTSDNASAAFTSGKTPFMVAGPWRLPDVRTAGTKYAISPVPGFAGAGPARSFVGVQSFFVASKGANKALAQEFVSTTLGSPEVADALYEAEPRLPALKESLEKAAADPDVKAFQDAAATAEPLPSIPQMVAIWGPFNTLIHAVIKGEPVAAAVTAAGAAIKEQLGS